MKPMPPKVVCPAVWVLFAGLCISASAQTPEDNPPVAVATPQAVVSKPTGMRELVLLVLQNHPELSQAEAESRLALSRVSEARSSGYPQLSFSSSYGQEQQKLYLSNRTNVFKDQAQAQLKLTQPLFDQSLGANLRRFKAGSLGMDWQLVMVREQLVLKTVELYIEVVRQHQLTELARQNLKLHRNYVSQMKQIALTDLGRASDLSVAQARVALAESTFTNRMARLESARLQWRNHSGMNPPALSDLGNFDQLMAEFGNVPLPPDLESAISEAINNSPQLQKSLSEVKSSWHSLELSRSATRPKINAEAVTRTGQNYGFVAGRQDNITLGVNLQWTLPVNPGYKHSNRAAREAIIASESAVDATTYKVRSAVETQWFELLANQASVNTFQAYVDSSVQVVNAYAEQFKIGRRSLLDVLNAENELFTARTNAMTASTDATLSAWRLLSLRGYLADYLEL
ncbi:MAG: TolC family protein [Burkholderiales bacterium]|jgi:adhesin transport system outer membrane protein|nr:TolC family protein [Burkholderiales bacterium]